MGVYKLSGAGGLLTPRVNHVSMLAGNAAFVEGDYELIETQVLVSAVSSITFASLATYASTYKHLQIRVVGRNSRADEWAGVLLRFNGDSSSTYSAHFVKGDGGSVTSGATTNSTSINNNSLEMAGNTQAANIYSPLVYDILDPYSTTKNKTVRYFGGRGAVSSADRQIALFSGVYRSTNSTTSLSLTASPDGNFVIGSRFSLYGIK